LNEYKDSIIKSVSEDLDDESYKEFCGRYGKKESWGIGTARLPDDPNFNERLNIITKDEKRFEVPFPSGESLLINYAILASHKYRAIPITDDEFHLAALKRKLTKKIDMKSYHIYYNYHKNAKRDLTASRIIDLALPSIENIDVDDLIKFRNDHIHSLTKFRNGMAKLATDIQTRYYDDEFEKEIRDKIDNEIMDSLNELRESMKIWNRVSKIGKPILKYLVPIIADIIPGKSLDFSSHLDDLITDVPKAIQEDIQRKRNGLAYLIEIERKFHL